MAKAWKAGATAVHKVPFDCDSSADVHSTIHKLVLPRSVRPGTMPCQAIPLTVVCSIIFPSMSLRNEFEIRSCSDTPCASFLINALAVQ